MLISLVERLNEGQAAQVLDLLSSRYAPVREHPLPPFVGMGHDGEGEIGQRAKEIVRDEMGRSRRDPTSSLPCLALPSLEIVSCDFHHADWQRRADPDLGR